MATAGAAISLLGWLLSGFLLCTCSPAFSANDASRGWRTLSSVSHVGVTVPIAPMDLLGGGTVASNVANSRSCRDKAVG